MEVTGHGCLATADATKDQARECFRKKEKLVRLAFSMCFLGGTSEQPLKLFIVTCLALFALWTLMVPHIMWCFEVKCVITLRRLIKKAGKFPLDLSPKHTAQFSTVPDESLESWNNRSHFCDHGS